MESGLVGTDEEMKEFDLVLRILGEEGSVDGEGRQVISEAFRKFANRRDNFHQQQDYVEDKLEAFLGGIMAGLRERLTNFTTREASPELKKKAAEQTYAVIICAEQTVKMMEMLQVAERRAEGRGEVEGMDGEGVKGEGRKAVSANRKKWQAKSKALPVESVTTATQTVHIQEPLAIQVDDDTEGVGEGESYGQ